MPLHNQSTLTRFTAVAFLFLAQFAYSAVFASEFVPATFNSNSFFGLEIKSNEIPENTDFVIVPCQVIVEVNGGPSNYNCTTRFIKSHHNFLRAVLNAIPKQSFVPATVNDQTVRVQMNFTVLFGCKERKCVNSVVRNHLFHYKEYGLNYVAPQPIIHDVAWYDGYEIKNSWANNLIERINVDEKIPDEQTGWIFLYSSYFPAYTLSAEINVEGEASDQLIDNTANVQKSYAYDIKKAAERAIENLAAIDFIPGFYNDEPVTMRLHEWGMMKISGREPITPAFFPPHSTYTPTRQLSSQQISNMFRPPVK